MGGGDDSPDDYGDGFVTDNFGGELTPMPPMEPLVQAPASPPPPSLPSRIATTPATATVVVVAPQQQDQLPNITTTHNNNTPVLSTAATAGLLGAILGSLTGTGSLTGGLLLSSFGAYAATRDDHVGQQARNVGEQARQAAMAASEHPLAQDIQRKLAPWGEKLTVEAEKHRVPEKLEHGKIMANGLLQRGIEFERNVVKPKMNAVFQTIKEKDTNGYLTTAETLMDVVNRQLGISESFAVTRDAVSAEFRVLFPSIKMHGNNSDGHHV